MTRPQNKVAAARVRDELAAEHEAIRGLVGKLRTPRTAPHDAFDLLAELHVSLAGHFAHEQYPGGLYEAMGACTTEHLDDLRVLVDEHFLIISAVQSLKERAREPGAPDPSFDEEVSGLVARIGEHERREHDLVSRLVD